MGRGREEVEDEEGGVPASIREYYCLLFASIVIYCEVYMIKMSNVM
jgi:hypothetical protein